MWVSSSKRNSIRLWVTMTRLTPEQEQNLVAMERELRRLEPKLQALEEKHQQERDAERAKLFEYVSEAVRTGTPIARVQKVFGTKDFKTVKAFYERFGYEGRRHGDG